MDRPAYTILYTQKLEPADAQAFIQRSLDTHTQRHLHKSSSHRYGRCVYTQAFEHKCLYTQKHLHRDASTYTRLCTQKLLHTDFFRRIAEALTQRSLYTANPLHTEAFTHRSSSTQKLFHRSFYTEKLLRTGSFTHRRLYTEKLVHTEAFTHRSFYTEKPLHTDAFPQKNRFHRAAFTCFQKSQFYLSF